MADPSGSDAKRHTLAVGAVTAGSVVSLATYFAVGGPFGTLNDVGNAAVGVLSGALAWRLRGHVSSPARAVAVGAALGGAAVTVVGSALVVSKTTGFLLAGLVSSVGFAGIGTWLVALNRSQAAHAWSPQARRLGVTAGAVMALGILAAPGIALRLDDAATAPGWVWIGLLGWLGTYVAYPAWAVLVFARSRDAAGRRTAATAETALAQAPAVAGE